MSQDDYDDLYVDDIDMLELNKNLPNTEARATMEEDAMSKAVGEKLYGPTGRGSPEMRNKSPYELSRYAGKALRDEGIKDDRHLKNTKAWDPKSEQQKKEEAEDAKIFDEMLSNMYKEMKKPVARHKANPSSKKGGTRKRNKRSRRGSRRNKRSRRGNKRSRK